MRVYYEDAISRIYHADCIEVLESLEELEGAVDLLLTDPPYGQAFQGASTKKANIRADGARQGVRIWRQALARSMPLLAPGAHVYAFCHWESWPDFYDATSPHLAMKSALIWDKAQGGMGDTELEYARDYEVILFGCEASARVPLRGSRSGEVLRGFKPVHHSKRVHPTEKPVDLLEHLIEKSSLEGGLILDPFAGSCPVAAAAKKKGRMSISIEIEERYCEEGAKRLSAIRATVRP